MPDRTDSEHLAEAEWIQVAHTGPLVKPGLEGNACHGGSICLARPQHVLQTTRDDFMSHVESSQAVIREWLSKQSG